MQSINPDFPKLTRNDQQVLKEIILRAKLPDTEIAKKMKISPQAVFKIRRKLEETGIIQGYQPVLDLKKLGIQAMALLVIKLTPEVWDQYTDEEISARIKQIPYVITAYRISESNITHALIMGFRDIEQRDKHIGKLQTKFGREIEIKDVYTFGVDKVITNSPVGLLYEILDKKEHPLDEFFLKKRK
ncbi:MAG: Lrp/AsnC family transcriptional regulator [Candidatus Woesearchaeota archaeon]